jgi:hypothetical protein
LDGVKAGGPVAGHEAEEGSGPDQRAPNHKKSQVLGWGVFRLST